MSATIRDITVAGAEGGSVSGVLVLPPDATGGRPTLVLGHDLGSHCRADKYVDLAIEYATRERWAVAILDGPFHGDREPDELRNAPEGPGRFPLMRQQMSAPGRSATMSKEWSALLDLLADIPEVGPGPVAFEGISMSALYGVAFVADEPRVVAGVFHVVGIRTGELADVAGPELGGEQFAAKVRAIGNRPVQLLAQADDELVPREASYLFFDTLPNRDESELIVLPGTHRQPPVTPIAGREYAAAFLRRHLPLGA